MNHKEQPRNIEEKYFSLEINPDFLDFQKVIVTKVDESKPWKPPIEVKVIKQNGDIIENLDANTPFFKIIDKQGNSIIITAASAGHIDELHIKAKEPGSKFSYNSLVELFEDIIQKLPPNVASEPGVTAFAIEMNREMGKEGLASIEELLNNGIIDQQDINILESYRTEVFNLNKSGTIEEKHNFIKKYQSTHPDAKIQFQIIRNKVLVPVIRSPKKTTTKLFMAIGPNNKGQKIIYTMAPGRYMPKHPNPDQHKDKNGVLDEESFEESANAWFDNIMLIGE